ncbi:GNAT family N-acetyltransferase [Candidatus Kaiserbacteria bacterium]|nr:GNAT family N-acetyltransferase [Candidatus Kaiserbacteria bacterium]USN92314.1 MAG: GNAT family N-acetyltransferase [Candidatus Nomurabacteria bacterium]
MEIKPQTIKVVVSEEIFDHMPKAEAEEQYKYLMSVLHGRTATCRPVVLSTKRFCESEHTIFLLHRNIIVGTGQISLADTFPTPHVYINNIVISPFVQKLGLGARLMRELSMLAVRKWGGDDRTLRLELTNNPNKKNAGFYYVQGFRARADGRWPVLVLKQVLNFLGWKAEDETVVWVKEV